jgi:hypothetical protein
MDDKLKKLHASGIYVELLKENNSLFSNTKEFVIRLDKLELVADLLLGIRNNDPLMVHLSKLQGLKLSVSLSHTKFIFSNNLNLYISLVDLPEYFKNQAILFSELMNYSKENPQLIKTTFNVWNNALNLQIPKLKHHFQAENNLSYDIGFDNFEFDAYIHSHSEFNILTKLKNLNISLDHFNKKAVSFKLTQGLINLISQGKNTQIEIKSDHVHFGLNVENNSSIELSKIHSFQSYQEDSMTDFTSRLNINKLLLHHTNESIQVNDFDYDIVLEHLNPQTLSHITELIHTSNTNSVAFVFDDLSDNILSLIKDNSSLNLTDFSFSDLLVNDKHFYDAKLSLKAQSQAEVQEQPILLNLNLHLSKTLYEYFLNNVANASFTKHYLKSPNSIDFHLSLTPEGFILNDKELLFNHVDNNSSENNQTEAINFL